MIFYITSRNTEKTVSHPTWTQTLDFITCNHCGFGFYPSQPWFQDGKCFLIGEAVFRPKFCPGCGSETDAKNLTVIDSTEWAILSALGVQKPRRAIEAERAYMDFWLQLGVSLDFITYICRYTYSRKGKVNWPYAHCVIKRCAAAGCITPEQVAAQKLLL